MKRKKIIINALILTLSTMTLGFIGMGFRVYLSNRIGAEGMGLYQLIMSIYIMASTISISGIRVTTTRLIAEELGRNNTSNISTIMKKSFIYSLFFSITMFFTLYKGAEFIATNWIHDSRAIIPLKILSLCLPFIGIGACFHGYFYGMRKVVKSISADIIESATMMGIIVYFMGVYLPKGLDFTCALLATGMSVGNIVCTIYFYILYLFENKPSFRKKHINSKYYTLFKVAYVSLPIAGSSYIQMGLKTVEDILIPNSLRQFGSSTSSSLAIFGMIKGMALPILYFPAIFLASFSTLIIPEISEASALKQNRRVIYIISRVFKVTLLIAIFASGLFIIFSKEMGMAIYKNAQVGVMMKILAPLIPFMYLDRVVDGSLNALDQQMSTLRYNIFDMCIRIFLILYLIPKKGIEGFIIVLFAGTLINSLLSINKLLKVTNLKFMMFDWFINPALCIALAGNLIKYLSVYISPNISLPIQVVFVLILYIVFLILFRCIKKDDITWFTSAFKSDLINSDFSDIGLFKRF